jgi:hypothetical protein
MFVSAPLRSVVCLLFLLAGIAAPASGQATDEIVLDAPDGWRGERIALPPTFAPTMTFQGVEQIRFAPGMFRADAEDFFSYALVFRLRNEKLPDEKQLSRELLVYFQGLAKAVSKGTIETGEFSLEMKAVAEPPRHKAIPQAVGTLAWTEPFATKARQSLRIESHAWTHNDHRWVFLCVSPKPPNHDIWKSLHKIRDGFLQNHPN